MCDYYLTLISRRFYSSQKLAGIFYFMGYTLIIGELKSEVIEQGLESYIKNYAELHEEKNAPAFGEPTDYSNQRWPSYSSWHDSMMFVGLQDFMFNKEYGLLYEHPGIRPIVKQHKEIIDQAYAEFYKKYPNCKAGYSPKLDESKGIYEDPEWPMENNYATRLEWLKFWVDWALENCKQPIFYNS